MLSSRHKVHVYESKKELDQAAAKFWVEQANQSVAARGSFYVALTGGSSPQSMYRLLATSDYASQLEWQKIHVYIGDERFVPQQHPDSNFGMTRNCLLDHISIPEKNLHPIQTDLDEAERAAELYARELEVTVPSRAGQFPQLDLIMLGMGDDGHTASLFPDTEILSVKDRTAAAVYVDKLSSWRVSLTYPVLNAARSIMFIVTGENKSTILQQVLADDSKREYPVQGLEPEGAVHWFLDSNAASQLS